ncbi:MAG: hypothetical protein WCT14_10155 [Treponemataceae bacterium]
MKQLILEKAFERSLERVLSSFPDCPAGSALELWVFEDASYRRSMESRFASRGISARVRSAYKPLLCFFLDEAEREGLARAHVAYPVRPECAPDRFLMEAYPLAALLENCELSFSPRADDRLFYEVTLLYADGRRTRFEVFAPNRLKVDHIGETVLSPVGWIRHEIAGGIDAPLETEYESIYSAVMESVATHDWGEVEPFFGVLSIRVSLPAMETVLPYGEETLSLSEALHEDLYFSLLEYFQKKTGRPVSDRTIRPGQIVPEIVHGQLASLTIETRTLPKPLADSAEEIQDLDTAVRPLSPAQISAELKSIGGERFEARSYLGRALEARYRSGSDAAVLISGGQHANETTGIVGALRAAKVLARRPNAHFAVEPLENPDGYDLHRQLRVENPKHMHHAARYTALGNDLEYQTDDSVYEKALRMEALRRCGAQLHVNLHGYPSHEWTRPNSGYIPRGFASWTLPHGFFLVLRHHASWAERVEIFLDAMTRRLCSVPGLITFNKEQLKLYSIHTRDRTFRLINGFPCMCSVDTATTVPVRLITEYPDETVYADAFVAGHTAQMEAVLAAYDAFQTISSPTGV